MFARSAAITYPLDAAQPASALVLLKLWGVVNASVANFRVLKAVQMCKALKVYMWGVFFVLFYYCVMTPG